MKDKKIHSESSVWSTAQGEKKIYGFDDNVGFEKNQQISWLWQTVFVGIVMC